MTRDGKATQQGHSASKQCERPHAPSARRRIVRKQSSFKKTSPSTNAVNGGGSKERNRRPRRPLGAYNLFFRDERSNILNGTTSSLTSSILSGKGDSEEMLREILRSDVGSWRSNTANADAAESSTSPFQTSSIPTINRNRHAELTRLISAKWRTLDAPSRAIYDGLALLERKKYEKDMEQWTGDEGRRKNQEEHAISSPSSSESESEEALGKGKLESDDFESDASVSHNEVKKCSATRWQPSPVHSPATDLADIMETPANDASTSLSLSDVHMSIIERKRQLQYDAEREYAASKRPKQRISRVTSRVASSSLSSCFSIPHEKDLLERLSEKVKAGKQQLLQCKVAERPKEANEKVVCSEKASVPGVNALAGKEKMPFPQGGTGEALEGEKRTERNAANLADAFLSDMEEGKGVERYDPLCLPNDVCGDNERSDNNYNGDRERIHGSLYDPIPVAVPTTAGEHETSQSLNPSVSNSLVVDASSSASTAVAPGNGARERQSTNNELDGESVRFLASIFCARSA